FLRKEALQKWHPTFEEMQRAVADVLDHLDRYDEQLATLLTERFHLSPRIETVVVGVGQAASSNAGVPQRGWPSCSGGETPTPTRVLCAPRKTPTAAAVLGKTRYAPVYHAPTGRYVHRLRAKGQRRGWCVSIRELFHLALN